MEQGEGITEIGRKMSTESMHLLQSPSDVCFSTIFVQWWQKCRSLHTIHKVHFSEKSVVINIAATSATSSGLLNNEILRFSMNFKYKRIMKNNIFGYFERGTFSSSCKAASSLASEDFCRAFRNPNTMKRFVSVSNDSAPPCSQSTLDRDVP